MHLSDLRAGYIGVISENLDVADAAEFAAQKARQVSKTQRLVLSSRLWFDESSIQIFVCFRGSGTGELLLLVRRRKMLHCCCSWQCCAGQRDRLQTNIRTEPAVAMVFAMTEPRWQDLWQLFRTSVKLAAAITFAVAEPHWQYPWHILLPWNAQEPLFGGNLAMCPGLPRTCGAEEKSKILRTRARKQQVGLASVMLMRRLLAGWNSPLI